jgi:2-methylcitrate dehydratase PrpD
MRIAAAGKSIAEKISAFVAETRLRNIPPPVREQATLHMLDGLATMLGGANETSSRILRTYFSAPPRNARATVVGAAGKFSAEQAALINGLQCHVLDYDDAQLATLPNRPAGQQTHPTAPVLAAALALAEDRGRSGRALLASYIVGVEVACRLGDAVDPGHYRDGYHPTGTLGIFGAAAACAHLLRLQPKSVRRALGLAGTLASGLRANRGTMAKGLNAGHAARCGLLAATLAARGFTASENIFDDAMGVFAALCRHAIDTELLHFGDPFFFASPGVALKLYPCAGVLHPALDISLELRRRHTVAAQNITRITVTLDRAAASPLVYSEPTNALEARFSLQFAVAVALIRGAAGLKEFAMPLVRDRAVRSLMKRIELVRRTRSREATEAGVDTVIEITLSDGGKYRGRSAIAQGHPTLPLPRAAIEEKFLQCADGVVSEKQAARFLRNFARLERIPALGKWLDPLRPRRR